MKEKNLLATMFADSDDSDVSAFSEEEDEGLKDTGNIPFYYCSPFMSFWSKKNFEIDIIAMHTHTSKCWDSVKQFRKAIFEYFL